MRQAITTIIFLASIVLIGCQPEKKQNSEPEEPDEVTETSKEPEPKAAIDGPEESETIGIDPDSVAIIASMFLYEGIAEDSKYYLEEPDIDKVYRSNPTLASRYYVEILNTYELTFYQKLNIAYYLYLSNEPQHFQKLKDKTDLTESEKRSVDWYISNYKMDI